MAEVLAKQPRPAGPRLTIVTNAGGPGVLATDALIGGGGELAELSAADASTRSNGCCRRTGATATRSTSSATPSPERYAKALEIAAEDPNSDGLLVILTPQAMTDPTRDGRSAEGAGARTAASRCWRAGWAAPTSRPARRSSAQANIPTFPYPDTAARVFNYMWRYSDNLRGLYETPSARGGSARTTPPAARRVDEIVAAARAAGRTLLTEFESKQLLAAYGIPDRRDARRGHGRRGGRRARRRSAIRSC